MEIIKREESLESYGEDTIDLQELVSNATWQELLTKLVETKKLDPWNIDIAAIVDSYISAVQKMKLLDLFVPANVVFAASVLLRIKSESIKIIEDEPEEDGVLEAFRRQAPAVEELVPKLRHQPNAVVTLQELISALDEAMAFEAKRMERIAASAPAPLQLNIDTEDIDDKIDSVLGLVKRSIDPAGMTTFDAIAGAFYSSDSILVDLFVPLLYLYHRGALQMFQEEFFKEIFIKV
ncbi:segregation/condensation protein A [Candidatus Marsarchaeota archaeon]|nr:segregation/condensation protein A [Candidatus Marsarchaeota archaeon]MCL5404691.1 segregation/condensation protein A [Candidatus Marsarchaeota archaeon]